MCIRDSIIIVNLPVTCKSIIDLIQLQSDGGQSLGLQRLWSEFIIQKRNLRSFHFTVFYMSDPFLFDVKIAISEFLTNLDDFFRSLSLNRLLLTLFYRNRGLIKPLLGL